MYTVRELCFLGSSVLEGSDSYSLDWLVEGASFDADFQAFLVQNPQNTYF